MSGGSGVVVGGNDNVHDQEVSGDGNAEPTVPTISLRDVDSDATGADDMSDHEVVHVARRRLVLLGFDDQVRGSRRDDQTHASPSSDTESLISRDGHSEGRGRSRANIFARATFSRRQCSVGDVHGQF